jgi:hypothetical protein
MRGHNLVKPNYQFEKRQRELEKKRKQEEKRLRDLAAKNTPDSGSADSAGGPESPEAENPGTNS